MNVSLRIVSLLPGATEWVCQLGLKDQLVGVSHECDFPSEVAELPRVTRSRIPTDRSSREIDQAVRDHSDSLTPLYDLDQLALERLKPDLILTQSLCNVCAVSQKDVLNLASRLAGECKVLDLPARTFDDVLADAKAISEATGNQPKSLQAIDAVEQRIAAVRREVSVAKDTKRDSLPRVTLLEWTDPIFCSGHWTPQLIEWAGGRDPIGKTGQPSREIPFDDLVEADPDILLVACCGMDLRRTESEFATLRERVDWNRLSVSRSNQVHLFDGSAFFNRPGPRLVETLEEVARIIRRWQIG